MTKPEEKEQKSEHKRMESQPWKNFKKATVEIFNEWCETPQELKLFLKENNDFFIKLYQTDIKGFNKILVRVRDQRDKEFEEAFMHCLRQQLGINPRMFLWNDDIAQNTKAAIENLEKYYEDILVEEDSKKTLEVVRVLKNVKTQMQIGPSEIKRKNISPAVSLNNLLFKIELGALLHQSDHILNKPEYRGSTSKLIALVFLGLCLPPLGGYMLLRFFCTTTSTQKRVNAIHSAAGVDPIFCKPSLQRG